MSTARVDFTRGAAERIARVVRIVETGERDGTALSFKKPVTESVGSKTFRICTFTGGWSKQVVKTITFRNQTSTPNTTTAINLFADIATSTVSTRNCAIGKDGTAWYLIAAEC
jgi:hypothetical protein